MIIVISQSLIYWIFILMKNGKQRIRAEIPELPDARKKRYVEELGLPAYDAEVLTVTKEMADFFEATVAAGADAKLASNWLMGDVSAYLKCRTKGIR